MSATAVVAISDTHLGSTYALLPPHGCKLDDGSWVMPNPYQQALWKCWLHFWKEFVPREVERADRVAVVVNGDLIDGVHHNTIALISTSWEIQESLAVEVLAPIPRHVGPTWVVRGTPAHSGEGAQSEERIARAIGAQEVDGRHSVYQLWLEAEGVTMQFAHHIGVTSSSAYESSAPMRELIASLVEESQWGRSRPSVLVRSHRHRYIKVEIPCEHDQDVIAVITPAWQLRTPYVERIDRMRLPHIGGIVLWLEDGKCTVKRKTYRMPQAETIRL